MTTPTPELPPMTPKVKEALADYLHSAYPGIDVDVNQNLFSTWYREEYFKIKVHDAIRESMQQPVADAPAPLPDGVDAWNAVLLELLGGGFSIMFGHGGKSCSLAHELNKKFGPPPAAAPDLKELAKMIHAEIWPNKYGWKGTWEGDGEDVQNRTLDAARAAIEYCKGKTGTLRADREKVAIAIEDSDGEDAIDRSGWDDYLYTKRMRQADAAIAAMGAEPVDVAKITAERDLARTMYQTEIGINLTYKDKLYKIEKERDAARAELAELRKLVEGQKADANNFLLEVGRLENKHNKKES